MNKRSRAPFGFLGGSFDPIHRGHIALARAALRERGLARVYLVPTSRSPLKAQGPRGSPDERALWIRSAIRGQRGLFLGPWEMNRRGPSYTFDTLRRLERLFPGRRWELILGEDSWRSFRRWRHWKKIIERFPLVVGRRRGARGGSGPAGACFLKARLPAVSSTHIREAMGPGRFLRSWLVPSVAKEIEQKGKGVLKKSEEILLAKILSPARFEHVRAVARWAAELARLHGADPKEAARAGWFHDLAKEWSPARLVRYARRHRLSVPGIRSLPARDQANFLHGVVSAHWAGRRGWVSRRDTRTALARHTLGHPRMSRLDQILYVADFSSSDRRGPQARRVRRLARRDLDEALRAAVGHKIQFVVEKGAFLHPAAVALWNAQLP